MASLGEAGSHRHDAIDVDIGILGNKEKRLLVGQAKKAKQVQDGNVFGKGSYPKQNT